MLTGEHGSACTDFADVVDVLLTRESDLMTVLFASFDESYGPDGLLCVAGYVFQKKGARGLSNEWGAMLEKYDLELTQIERAFGVKWETAGENGDGQHVLIRDPEEALEEMSDPEWQPKIDYGFPYEESESVSSHDDPLHSARERPDVESPI